MTVQFDLLPSSPFPMAGASVQPAQALTRTTGTFPPSTLYIGLIVANPWSASVSVTLGQYATAGNPNVFSSGANRSIQLCTTAGTSASVEPVWNQTPGSMTSDGTAVWTETSLLFNAGTFPSGVEPTDAAYDRAPFDNSVTITYKDTVNPNPTIRFPNLPEM